MRAPADRPEDALSWAVEAAGKTKVVVSGGAKQTEQEFLEMARNIMKAGAIGMAVGRNIWQNKDPMGITERLKEVIFEKE